MLSEFNEYLRSCVNRSIYVLGGQAQAVKDGIVYSDGSLEKKLGTLEEWLTAIGQKKNRAEIMKTYERVKNNAEVIRVVDCSGLGMNWLQNVMHLSGDLTAEGMRRKCAPTGVIRNGVWCFKLKSDGTASHIGYCVEGGIISARGKAYGVVDNETGWDCFGVPEFFKDEIAEVKMSFYRNMRKGMVGDDVIGLQELLINKGFPCGKCGADGDFGSNTLKAVKAAQKAYHMTVDGIAGPKTVTALGGEWGNKPKGEITICTFNVKRGTYKSGTHKIIGSIIKDADIIGLQEVTPSGLKAMASAAGRTKYMCETISGYGHGILTNYAVSGEKVTTLPGGGEKRKAHHVMIGGVSFYNTHFHYTQDANDKQYVAFRDMLHADKSSKIIVTGDFNRQEFGLLVAEGFKQTNTGITNRIDQVFCKGVEVKDVWIYEAVKKKYSDHDALFVRVKV